MQALCYGWYRPPESQVFRCGDFGSSDRQNFTLPLTRFDLRQLFEGIATTP